MVRLESFARVSLVEFFPWWCWVIYLSENVLIFWEVQFRKCSYTVFLHMFAYNFIAIPVSCCSSFWHSLKSHIKLWKGTKKFFESALEENWSKEGIKGFFKKRNSLLVVYTPLTLTSQLCWLHIWEPHGLPWLQWILRSINKWYVPETAWAERNTRNSCDGYCTKVDQSDYWCTLCLMTILTWISTIGSPGQQPSETPWNCMAHADEYLFFGEV